MVIERGESTGAFGHCPTTLNLDCVISSDILKPATQLGLNLGSNLERKMPDFSMCKGDGCTQRNQCYRFRAKPNKSWQSFFMNVPGSGDECDDLIPIGERPEHMLTEIDEPEPPRRAGELEPGEEVTFGGTIRQTGIKRGPYQGIQPRK